MSEPVVRHYSGGLTALMVIGLILLLPGVCALVFVLGMIKGIQLGDAISQLIVTIWAICFAVSSIGVLLIVLARKWARITS